MSSELIGGTLFEYSSAAELIGAAKCAHRAGFRKIEAFTPFALEELDEFIEPKKDRVAFFTLLGGILGGLTGFGMQWYSNVVDYPINLGGRPMFAWQAFIPITFELTVLGAALTGVCAMLYLNSLPQWWHPVFDHAEFLRASRDRFFLYLTSDDPMYVIDQLRGLSLVTRPLSFSEVQSET